MVTPPWLTRICRPYCVAMWTSWRSNCQGCPSCSCSLQAAWWMRKRFKAKTRFCLGLRAASWGWQERQRQLLPMVMDWKARCRSLVSIWAAPPPTSAITPENLSESLIPRLRACACEPPCCTSTRWRRVAGHFCNLMARVFGWGRKARVLIQGQLATGVAGP